MDYNFLMESRLERGQYRIVNLLGRMAAQEGLNFYLVGGAVRDLTYGQQTIRDLDFVAEGKVDKLLHRLTSPPPRHSRLVDPHAPPDDDLHSEIEHVKWNARWNSAEVTFTGGRRCEIAPSCALNYSRPGRPPEIERASIFESLRGRDFSVNAMAISLHPNSRGLLLDPTNGAADIERRELRALHIRSFFDDPLRIYRLLRLALRLSFAIEEKTGRWLDWALSEHAADNLDQDQKDVELRAILYEEQCGAVLKMLRERGLLAGLDRKIASARIPYERFDRIRAAMRQVPSADPHLLNFVAVTEKLAPAVRTDLAKRLLGSAKEVKLALSLEHDARKVGQMLGGPKGAAPSQVYTLLSGVPQPVLLFLLAHAPQPKVQNRVKAFLFKYPGVRAALPRAELAALGMEYGPKFDRVMERIFFEQLDGKLKTHQQLQKALRDYSGIKPPKPAPEEVVHGKKKHPKEPSRKEAASKEAAKHVPPPKTAKAAAPVKEKPAKPAAAGKQAAKKTPAAKAPKLAPERGAAKPKVRRASAPKKVQKKKRK